jgi:hypothetical protein
MAAQVQRLLRQGSAAGNNDPPSTIEEELTMMSRMIRNSLAGLGVLAALPFALGACATTGTASGELKEPTGSQEPVTLSWKSDATDPDRGRIAGTLADGVHYSGKYFEVIKTVDEDVYGPAWDGWRPYWPGWGTPTNYEYGWRRFLEIYTGRVIANLRSDDGKVRLRCRFTIEKPLEGLKGGGSGDCQLSNGESIKNVDLSAS